MEEVDRNIDNFDLEEQLESFFIRRQNSNDGNPSGKGKSSVQSNVKQYIPMLLRDLKTVEPIDESSKDLYKVFGGKVVFTSCIIYGRIMGRLNGTDHFAKYIVDDGTGCAEISISKRQSEMQEARLLEMELNALARSTAQNKQELAKSLGRILKEARNMIDTSNIIIGSRAFIYGVPSCFRDGVSINAFVIHMDNNTSRNLEVDFKSNLTQWYLENRGESDPSPP